MDDSFRGTVKKLLLFSIFICSIFLFMYATINPIGAGDTWWYLSCGRYIVENRTVPETDVFSYTFRGKPWINAHWMTNALFYIIYSNFGREGLAWYKVMMVVIILSLVVARTYRKTGDYYLSLICLVVIAFFARIYLDIRAQLATFLFINICMLLLDFYRDGKKWVLYFIPLMIIPWVNLHGGFVYVFFILGSLWLAELINIFSAFYFGKIFVITGDTIKSLPDNIKTTKLEALMDKEFSRDKLKNNLYSLNFSKKEAELILSHALCRTDIAADGKKSRKKSDDDIKEAKKGFFSASAVIVITFIAGLINPYFFTVYTYPFKILNMPSFKETLEWVPAWEIQIQGFMTPLFWPYCLFFIIFSIAEIRLAFYNKKKFSTVEFMIGWLTFFMSLSSRRFIPLFVVLSIPACLETFYYIYKVKSQNLLTVRILPLFIAFAFKGILILLIFNSFIVNQVFPAISYSGGLFNYLTVDGSFPDEACDFIKKNDLKGNLFNYYNWGGYISWCLYPEMYVFIDGRGNGVYSEEIYDGYKSLSYAKDWSYVQAFMEKYDVEVALLSRYGQKNVIEKLYASNKWYYCYQDQNSVIFLKKNEKYKVFMEKLQNGELYIPEGAKEFYNFE